MQVRGVGIVLLVWCSGVRAAGQPAAPPAATQSLRTDLDGDGTVEEVILNPTAELFLEVRQNGRTRWRGLPKRWQPWKLRAADVDGDGKQELILGVHKATRFFPHPHNCLFVFSWDGEEVLSKWLGSSLSKPFVDFEFLPKDKQPNSLVSVEVTREGGRCLNVYEWDRFGFAGHWQSETFETVSLTVTTTGQIHVVADGACRILSVEGDTFALRPCKQSHARSARQSSPGR